MEAKPLESAEVKKISLRPKVWEEWRKIWRVAFSAIICKGAVFGVLVVTQAFIGHSDKLDLAAFAVVQTVSVRFLTGIQFGMSSATQTLCAQAFGAKQCHMLGIYLQRSWIISFVTTIIFVPFLALATPFYRLIGQDEAIAKEAGKMSTWFIPYMYQNAVICGTLSFLQSQMKNKLLAWMYAASFMVHVLMSWILVSKLKMGVSGAMMALNLSTWLAVVGQLVYIFGGWCHSTWTGFSFAAFSDLWPFIKMSVSSGVMLCLEMWYMAALVLIAGYMKNAVTAVSAFSICLYVIQILFMVSFGFLTAASVRVSNELGAGDAKAVKFSIKVILITAACIGTKFWAMSLVFSDHIGYMFTNDKAVAKAVSSLSILLAFSILLNSVHPILSGVAIGAGRQTMVAYINVFSYYLIGVPLGVVLAFLVHLSIKGVWIGMLAGVAVQSFVLGFITWRTDWDHQVKQATERLRNHQKNHTMDGNTG